MKVILELPFPAELLVPPHNRKLYKSFFQMLKYFLKYIVMLMQLNINSKILIEVSGLYLQWFEFNIDSETRSAKQYFLSFFIFRGDYQMNEVK